MLEMMKQFIRDDDGAAAAEYAVLVAFIVAAVAAAVALFDIQNIFATVSNNVIGWVSSAPTAP